MSSVTRSEFAALMGWSKPYVSKLGKQGRLVLDAADKVLVEETKALLALSSDPSKAGVAERHQQERIDKGVAVHVSPDAPVETGPTEQPPAVPGAFNYQNSRAHREHYLAQLAESEARKTAGELVERAAVESAAYTSGRMLRDLVLGLPTQIAPALAAIADPWELERELTTHLRRVLEDASRLNAADLEHALKAAK